jgi:hypothetical protein
MTPTENFFYIQKKAFRLAVTAYATSSSSFFASSPPSAHGYFASLPGEKGGGGVGLRFFAGHLGPQYGPGFSIALSLALWRLFLKTFVSSCCGDEVGTSEGCLVWYRQRLCSMLDLLNVPPQKFSS